MLYPRPIDCSCGHEISWAAAIENLCTYTPYYAVRCICGKTSGVARTERQAAEKWNIMREEELKKHMVHKVKESWEMTQKESIASQIGGGYNYETIVKNIGDGAALDPMRRAHKKTVEQALSEGKPVPKAVLADYPELAKKTLAEARAIPEKAKEPILSTDSYGKSQVVYDRDIPKDIRYEWALKEIERLKSQIPEIQRKKIDATKAWEIDPARRNIGGLTATAWEKKAVTGKLGQIRRDIDILIKYAKQNEPQKKEGLVKEEGLEYRKKKRLTKSNL